MAHSLLSISSIGRWLAEMVQHAFGNPREEAVFQPPAVGVQPYRGTVLRRRGRRVLT